MRRIITSQKQIDDLRKELKLMQHDAEKMKSLLDKIEDLKKSKKSINSDEWYCIGITKANIRCSKSKNCHFFFKKIIIQMLILDIYQ